MVAPTVRQVGGAKGGHDGAVGLSTNDRPGGAIPAGNGMIGRRWRALAMAALLAFNPASLPPPSLLLGAAAASVAVAAPGDAWARASSSSRSSGGYSRPSSSSSSSSVRTPSTSGSSSGSGGYSKPSVSRTPSTSGGASSGGYVRPGASPSLAAPSAPQSAGDRALSQQGSADALNRYKAQQDAKKAPPPSAAPAPAANSGTANSSAGNSSGGSWNWGWGGGSSRTPSTRPAPAPYQNPYNAYGWTPPPYSMAAPRRFGIWDGLFLWFMLDTLTKPSHASFFHDQANDPGYREWRAEADRMAKDNADLRAKLAQLDQSLKAQEGTPREAGRLPPDVPLSLAHADSGGDNAAGAGGADGKAAAKAGMSSVVWWSILLLGVAILFLLWRARRRMDGAKPGQPAASSATANKGGSDVRLFGTLGNYVNQKLSGQRYSPSLFRLGMAVTIDPAPFLLAEGVTKVQAPHTGGDRLVSIDGVGTVTSGNATVHRLRLPGGGFFQIHLGPDGQPDECRYFTPIDSVAPANEEEWSFWLDEREGMVGWPEFQTKDGKLYPRVWSPGSARIAPFILSESLQTLRGTETLTSHAMLYGAPTGAPSPAPEREYILVAVVERNGAASVEIAAGIDVNPASLSLS
jgi:hypothetical protein